MKIRELIVELAKQDGGAEVRAQGTNEWTSDIELVYDPYTRVVKIIGYGSSEPTPAP